MKEEKLYPPKCCSCGTPIHKNPKTVITSNGFVLKHDFDCKERIKQFNKINLGE